MIVLGALGLFLFAYINNSVSARIVTVPSAGPDIVYTQTAAPAFTPTSAPTPIPVYANILIDPGHGGDDYGAEVESLNINEKTINMAIAARLYDLLRQDVEKVHVDMTRYNETTVSRPERVNMANASYDFLISIHCNTSDYTPANGVSTYYQTHVGIDKPFTSEELAEVIQLSAVEATGAHDRGIKHDKELYLLNHTLIPTVLIEVGYLTNPAELNRLLDDSYIDLLAEGLRQGILEMADRVIASRK